ncbi:hypothetical protein D3C84_1298490 [compost metagenome]
MLGGGQVFEQVGALRKGFFLELQKTVDERFHDRFLMGEQGVARTGNAGRYQLRKGAAAGTCRRG